MKKFFQSETGTFLISILVGIIAFAIVLIIFWPGADAFKNDPEEPNKTEGEEEPGMKPAEEEEDPGDEKDAVTDFTEEGDSSNDKDNESGNGEGNETVEKNPSGGTGDEEKWGPLF